MTGVVVVLLVAVVIALLAGVAVSAVRLRTALLGLKDAADTSAAAVQPIIDELTEASQVTTVESAQLQASVEQLRAGRRGD